MRRHLEWERAAVCFGTSSSTPPPLLPIVPCGPTPGTPPWGGDTSTSVAMAEGRVPRNFDVAIAICSPFANRACIAPVHPARCTGATAPPCPATTPSRLPQAATWTLTKRRLTALRSSFCTERTRSGRRPSRSWCVATHCMCCRPDAQKRAKRRARYSVRRCVTHPSLAPSLCVVVRSIRAASMLRIHRHVLALPLLGRRRLHQRGRHRRRLVLLPSTGQLA